MSMQALQDRTAGRGMNKQQKKQERQTPPEPVKAAEPSPPRQKTIEPHRYCPICWEGRGGYGTAYSKQGGKTYYKCDQTTKPEGVGPCGHTWSAVLRIEAVRVEHRVVEMDGER